MSDHLDILLSGGLALVHRMLRAQTKEINDGLTHKKEPNAQH